MKVRYDITGLRGMASIFIFLYHYNKKYISGGMIGVDIFFTITGYFITKSIIESLQTNAFSFFKFYSNRIKKLLPVCYIIWLFLLLIYNINIEKTLVFDIIYSILGIINYRFYSKSIDYLSKEEKPSLLLHFWTLSLQQQFYILFPIYLICFSKKYFYKILFITIMSFILCCYYSIYDVSYSYFSLATRLWEIGFGSLLYFLNNISIISNNTTIHISVAVIILFSFCFNSEYHSYPNYVTLIPVLCSCIIMINKHNNNELLLNYLFIFSGKISYSFYIIHYPFLQLFSEFKLIQSILLVYVISYITYIRIEYKYQSVNYSCEKIIITSLIMNILLTTTIIFCFTKFKKQSKFIFDEISGFNNYMKIQKSFIECPLNTLSPIFLKSYKFVLLGDCHVQQFLPIINKIAALYGYIVFHIYYWACYIEKGNYNEIFQILKSIGVIKVIFLSQYLSYRPFMFNYKIFSKNYIDYLYLLYNYNFTKDIFIIQNTGYNKVSVKNYLTEMNYNYYGYIGINFTRYLIPTIHNIKIIDLNSHLCKNNKCPFIIDDYIVYIDKHHLNPSFVEKLYPYFKKELKMKYEKQSKSSILKENNYYKSAICCNYKWRERKCMSKGD